MTYTEPTPTRAQFAKELRALRRRAGLTQAEVADLVDASGYRVVCQWESDNEKYCPGKFKRRMILRVLREKAEKTENTP